jgi:hypothetical protein
VSTEVASTRLPKEILREIDRAASARGVSRSVYLADLVAHGTLRGASGNGGGQGEALSTALAGELRELRESQRSLAEGLREIQVALRATGSPAGPEAHSPFFERLTFSTFFSEALIKRVSALLYRNPSELGQVVRAAREEALAEAKVWRERLGGRESPKESS